MRLCVLIPAHNEEGSIRSVLTSIPKILETSIEVFPIVIDDGGTDATATIARECGATVVSHPVRSGLAEAFRTGLSKALALNADFIATIDADAQYKAEELAVLLSRMRETNADLVVGDRQIKKLSHMPWKHKIGNRIGSAMLRMLGCTNVADASSGFRLFTARFAHALQIKSVHTYTHEMLIQAQAFGFRTVDVPVTFLPRAHGKSKLVRTLRHHILRSLGTIVRSLCLPSTPTAPKRVLFITRTLQSAPGGMQIFSKTLIAGMRDRSDIVLTVCGHAGGRLGLPFFFIRAQCETLFTRTQYVHFGDACTAALCIPLLAFFRPDLRLSVTVHGLDLTYPHALYRRMLRFSLPKARRVVAVSNATHDCAKDMGVPVLSLQVIHPAIANDSHSIAVARSSAPTLLLLGRHIRRKGTVWFLASVLPTLLKSIPNLRVRIAGVGPESESIRALVSSPEFGSCVEVQGAVSDEAKMKLFETSTLFLMPNIRIPGDMEGFGLVCLEASSFGLPIVAAKLEGIVDAVVDNETGMFFESENADDCVRTIKNALMKKWHPEAIQNAYRQKFGKDRMCSSYLTNVWN